MAPRRGGHSGGDTTALTAGGDPAPAGLGRRLGASGYEALVLAAFLMGLGFVLLPLVTPSALAPAPPASLALPSPGARAWFALSLVAASGAYCIGLWSGGRRTLPMKTWHLELRTAAGKASSPRTAALRFLACWIGPMASLAIYVGLQPQGLGRLALPALAVNYAWALFDREHLFLQDRIAGTRLTAPAAR